MAWCKANGIDIRRPSGRLRFGPQPRPGRAIETGANLIGSVRRPATQRGRRWPVWPALIGRALFDSTPCWYQIKTPVLKGDPASAPRGWRLLAACAQPRAKKSARKMARSNNK
jgi:hypothetical protein